PIAPTTPTSRPQPYSKTLARLSDPSNALPSAHGSSCPARDRAALGDPRCRHGIRDRRGRVSAIPPVGARPDDRYSRERTVDAATDHARHTVGAGGLVDP